MPAGTAEYEALLRARPTDNESMNTLIRAMSAQIEAMNRQLETERARYSALVDQLLQLKRDGFVPAMGGGPVDVETLPEDVAFAIEERAANTEVAKNLRAYAWRRLRQNAVPSDVAREILQGESFDEAPMFREVEDVA